MENGRCVEYHGVDPGELLEEHNPETYEQTLFGRSGFERFLQWNSVVVGLYGMKTRYLYRYFREIIAHGTISMLPHSYIKIDICGFQVEINLVTDLQLK